jgi:hypothetical protein
MLTDMLRYDTGEVENGLKACRVHYRIACEQALKLNWEPASMTNEFKYLRLKSWREILIGQML